jgi:polyisoprenyl-phosphate glycosyltransferase
VKTVSVVVPCYNEANNLPVLYRQLKQFFAAIDVHHEIIFVDDGSCDDSVIVLERLVATDPVVTAIVFSRNFAGPQPAILAGLRQSGGDAVVVMDADLQHPVRYIADFLKRWQQGAEVVYSIKSSCQESAVRRIGYWLFYTMLSKVAYVDIPNAGDFCLMSRRVVDAIAAMPDAVVWIRGMRALAGGKQVGIRYDCPPRQAGQTAFSLWRYLMAAREAITSYSYVPLRVLFILSLIVGVLSIMALPVVLLNGSGGVLKTLLIAQISIGAMQIVALGVCAECLRIIVVYRNR